MELNPNTKQKLKDALNKQSLSEFRDFVASQEEKERVLIEIVLSTSTSKNQKFLTTLVNFCIENSYFKVLCAVLDDTFS